MICSSVASASALTSSPSVSIRFASQPAAARRSSTRLVRRGRDEDRGLTREAGGEVRGDGIGELVGLGEICAAWAAGASVQVRLTEAV